MARRLLALVLLAASACVTRPRPVRVGPPIDPTRPIETRKRGFDRDYVQDGKVVDPLGVLCTVYHSPAAREPYDAYLRNTNSAGGLWVLGAIGLGASATQRDSGQQPYYIGATGAAILGALFLHWRAERHLADAIDAYNGEVRGAPAAARGCAPALPVTPAAPPRFEVERQLGSPAPQPAPQ